jgi:hypothetical protein
MSLPLIVKSKLFWKYNGNLDCCWYLGLGDDTSVAKQDAYIRDMDKFGVEYATLNICNEALSSPFSGEFMVSTPHEGKLNGLINFGQRLKDAGKKIAIVFFDCPQIPDSENPKYPVWKFRERIPDFLKIATTFLAPYVDGFMLGIETNRGPLSIDEVEYGIKLIKEHAIKTVGLTKVQLPVGTHEQNVGRDGNDKLKMNRRVPITADFVGYETSNHPFQGCNVSIARMVEEVTFLVANSNGKPVWVIESNEKEDDYARRQNAAVAAIPGVAGIGGPL